MARFDLSAPAVKLLREITLGDSTVIQSMAFTDDWMYTVQVANGGVKLPGEPAVVSGTDRHNRGDLTVTRLGLDGVINGEMHVMGSGHGVSMSTQVTGSTTYLWTETNSVNARGTDLCRFTFVSGTIYYPCSPYIEVFPFDMGYNVTPSIDGSRLAVRYVPDAGVDFRFAIFDLDDFVSGGRTPIIDIAAPDTVYTFQGWCLYDGHIYTLEGDSYGSVPDSDVPTGNTHITIVDAATGSVVDRQLTRAAYTLDYREPEGLTVQHAQAGPRLCMGFASGASGDRVASVYYKSALI